MNGDILGTGRPAAGDPAASPRRPVPSILAPEGPVDEDLRRRVDEVLGLRLRETRLSRGVISVATINTHRGRGPRMDCLRDPGSEGARERAALLSDARAWSYCIAEWLNRARFRFDVVGLQEVFNGVFGIGERFLGRFPQHHYYRVFSGFGSSLAHGVGFAGFRYENLLLSHLPESPVPGIRRLLPGRVLGFAACGFILAPFDLRGRTVWVGNTHLHAYNPRARMLQAASLARAVRRLGDVPVILLGDLNTVPPGCRDGDFPAGDRDVRSYRGDRTLRILARAGLRTVEHADGERFWTYPTGSANRTLDYVLFSRHFEVDDYRVEREFSLSDHYPVTASLRLR